MYRQSASADVYVLIKMRGRRLKDTSLELLGQGSPYPPQFEAHQKLCVNDQPALVSALDTQHGLAKPVDPPFSHSQNSDLFQVRIKT